MVTAQGQQLLPAYSCVSGTLTKTRSWVWEGHGDLHLGTGGSRPCCLSLSKYLQDTSHVPDSSEKWGGWAPQGAQGLLLPAPLASCSHSAHLRPGWGGQGATDSLSLSGMGPLPWERQMRSVRGCRSLRCFLGWRRWRWIPEVWGTS